MPQEMIGLHEADAMRLAELHGHTLRIACAGTDALVFDDLRPDRINISVDADGAGCRCLGWVTIGRVF